MTNTMLPTDASPGPASGGRKQRTPRSGMSWWAILLASLGALVIGVVVIGALGAVILGGGRFITERPAGLIELPDVPGAPEADIVMDVTPVGASGGDINAETILGGPTMGGESVVVADSTRIVSRVGTQFGTTTLYTWSEVEASNGPKTGPMDCFGGFSNGGGFSSCGPTAEIDDSEPAVSSGSTTSNDGTAFDASVTNLPEDAVWVVVETQSGYRVAAAVVEGIAFLQWPGMVDQGPADPVRIAALDEAFAELWSAPLG